MDCSFNRRLFFSETNKLQKPKLPDSVVTVDDNTGVQEASFTRWGKNRCCHFVCTKRIHKQMAQNPIVKCNRCIRPLVQHPIAHKGPWTPVVHAPCVLDNCNEIWHDSFRSAALLCQWSVTVFRLLRLTVPPNLSRQIRWFVIGIELHITVSHPCSVQGLLPTSSEIVSESFHRTELSHSLLFEVSLFQRFQHGAPLMWGSVKTGVYPLILHTPVIKMATTDAVVCQNVTRHEWVQTPKGGQVAQMKIDECTVVHKVWKGFCFCNLLPYELRMYNRASFTWPSLTDPCVHVNDFLPVSQSSWILIVDILVRDRKAWSLRPARKSFGLSTKPWFCDLPSRLQVKFSSLVLLQIRSTDFTLCCQSFCFALQFVFLWMNVSYSFLFVFATRDWSVVRISVLWCSWFCFPGYIRFWNTPHIVQQALSFLSLALVRTYSFRLINSSSYALKILNGLSPPKIRIQLQHSFSASRFWLDFLHSWLVALCDEQWMTRLLCFWCRLRRGNTRL